MKNSLSGILRVAGFLFVGAVGVPRAFAQAPPGPIRPTSAAPQPAASPVKQAPQPKVEAPLPPRAPHDLTGAWKLNRDESDDPRKVMQQRGGGNGGSGGGGRQRGGYPGGGYPGGGYPRGGSRGPGGGMGGESDEDRQRMQDVFRPPDFLTVTQKDGEVDFTDDRNHKRVFYTDGRKVKKSKDAANEEFSAKWDDNRLVSEDKISNGRKIVRTIEVASSGRYLYETVRVENGRSGGGISLRYVYDLDRGESQ
jgi:hypothetical protein